MQSEALGACEKSDFEAETGFVARLITSLLSGDSW